MVDVVIAALAAYGLGRLLIDVWDAVVTWRGGVL